MDRVAHLKIEMPGFLYEAPSRGACAAFFTESRRKFVNATKVHRKSGVWGTRRLRRGKLKRLH
jgi:hypothetical protein